MLQLGFWLLLLNIFSNFIHVLSVSTLNLFLCSPYGYFVIFQFKYNGEFLCLFGTMVQVLDIPCGALGFW